MTRDDYWVVATSDGRSGGVVGEFDGRIKYGRLLKPGMDASEAVYREKLREDDLRAEGLTVVRWRWADLSAFGHKAAQLRRSLT